MQSAVIMKIISLQSSFTASEHEISQFVIKNPDFVMTNTITTLAKKTNTSEASINRFCKKIGYKGFNNFKIALAQSNTQMEQLSDNREVDQSNIIEFLAADYKKMVMNTCAMLNEKDIEDAASMITFARKIFILSIYTTSFAAQETVFKLRQIGLDVTYVAESLEAQIALENMNSDSLLITVVPSINSKDIIPFLEKVKRRNVKTILISGNDNPKINDLVDLKLITPGHMVASNPLVISDSLMYNFVFDTIYATILKDNKTMRQRKLSSNTIIDSFQSAESNLYEW